MTTYNWEFGSLAASVHFTVTYDSEAGSFTVFCDKGSFDLGALWFSDGDTTKDFDTSLAKSDNSLNMNGTSTVWADDGSTTQEKIVWDDYAKPTEPTTITEGSTVTVTLTGVEAQIFEQLSNGAYFALGVRSTSVNGTSEGFKWADTQPEIDVNQPEVITNQAPIANAVSASGAEDDPSIAVTLSGSDSDGSVVSYTITSLPFQEQGTLYSDAALTTQIVAGDEITIGTVYFVPTENWSGDASFNYLVTDNDGADSATATASVTVDPVSDTPTLTVAPATGDEDMPIALSITPALTDTDGSEALSVTISNIPTGATLSNTAHDTLTISSGSITLTPDQLEGLAITPPNNSDVDFTLTVTATATDGTATPATTVDTISVTVNPVSDAPTLTVDPATGDEDMPIALSIIPALTDTDGSETLSVTISNIPTGATLSNMGNDVLTISSGGITLTPDQLEGLAITPPENFYGNFALTVTAISTDGLATPATTVDIINITVNPVNDAPVAVDDTLWVSESTIVTLPVSVLLGNDTDIDGKTITFQSVAESDSIISNLNFDSTTQTFTLEIGNHATNPSTPLWTDTAPGLATFTYTISDNATPPLTSTGTVTVKIVDVTNSGSDPINLSTQSYQGSYIDSVSGADTLTGSVMSSTQGDVFIGGAGDDVLIGGDGNDILQGGANNDVLNGGAGMDLLDYSTVTSDFSFTLGADGSGTSSAQGRDTYSGIEGVIGGSGNNTLTGNASENILIGAGGTDTLYGLGGDDILRGGLGDGDKMDGGTGTDLLDFSDGKLAISFTLQQGTAAGGDYHSIADGTGGLGNGDGYRNMEGVIGTNLDDTITGSSLNDVLMGGAGNDTLHGGAGNDTLIGGAGADTLEGGSGSDSFVFLKGDAASIDTISDFTTGAGGDSLDISSVLSDSGVSTGTLADYVSIREYNGNTIVSVDADAGGVASAQDIAILTNVTGVTLEDLNLILPPNP